MSEPVFSGDESRDMWRLINEAKTKGDLRRALYCVCCRLQYLESKLEREAEKRKSGKGKR